MTRCADIRLPMRKGRHPAHVMNTCMQVAFSLLLTALCSAFSGCLCNTRRDLCHQSSFDVKGQVPQSSSQATAEAAKAKARTCPQSPTLCVRLLLHVGSEYCDLSTAPRKGTPLYLGGAKRKPHSWWRSWLSFQLWWDYQEEKLTPECDLQSAGKGRSLTLSTPTQT